MAGEKMQRNYEKIKIFDTGNASVLEKTANSWLYENKGKIKVVSRQAINDGGQIKIIYFYEVVDHS
jgi:hypothetical protein